MTSSGAGRLATVVVLVSALLMGLAPGARASGPPRVLLFLIDRVSFEDLLSIPQARGLAGAGGAGLLSSRTSLRDEIAAAHLGGNLVRIVDLGSMQGPSGVVSRASLRRAGSAIAAALARGSGEGELAVIATPSPSTAMVHAKDQLTGIVVARGPASRLAEAAGSAPDPGALTTITSDSTRRVGVVTSADVVSTIRAFATSGPGTARAVTIRFDPATAPFRLHERYLADRRMSVPVQTAAGIYVTVVGLFGVAMLALGGRAAARARRAGALGALSLLPISISLLLAGHLPTLSYATVVPAIVLSSLLGTIVCGGIDRAWGVTATTGVAGAAVLALLGIEAALGWSAALTPFLGGSELDGGRFYGLPNVEIGLLLGASMYVATWIGAPTGGAAVMAAAGLFAGLPWTGSNLGGAVTLFAGAGLWYGIRRSGRAGLREMGYGLIAVGAGTVVVLAAHRYLSPFPTHITRFLEGQSGGIAVKIVDRLRVGLDLIARNPFALVPVLGVPTCLWVALHPPARIRSTFDRRPIWRQTILAILASSVVAYAVNDSGAAALGLGFGTGLAALLYVSLEDASRMMGP